RCGLVSRVPGSHATLSIAYGYCVGRITPLVWRGDCVEPLSRARHPRPFGGVLPGLLDPATLKIDGRTNPGGRQMLTIQPGSSDGFSAVRVGLYATGAYPVRLR